ncbi:IucA/IucC family protein [Paenibacillus aquistagni]|uniref:Siderophore synthetase component n=1 Tax=Paenibacillus aquistagni TaxID=1852522 RepID=A0A1X7I9F2_9BACL|nr:IucA/IucC family protein [Paenibacillus aquistagni]SMG11231.1 Siderophore synthetase component [Paenibacillus aquistagni]
MIDPMFTAEQATVSTLLNCYLRETRSGEWMASSPLVGQAPIVRIKLSALHLTIIAPVCYHSETGRHRYRLPIYVQSASHELRPIRLTTLASLLLEQIAASEGTSFPEKLLKRIVNSCRNLEGYIRTRLHHSDSLYEPNLRFLDYEQSLLFGHPFHPNAKSREGFNSEEHFHCSPETGGRFKLHYFAAHHTIVKEGSQWKPSASASALIKRNLLGELVQESARTGAIQREDKTKPAIHSFLHDPAYALVPVHPVQARWLLQQPHVDRWMRDGLLINLGGLGESYAATSSIRTVYRESAHLMYKFSLHVKITNSVRVNKRGELDRALEACQVLDCIEPRLHEVHPQFHFIRDSAYLTLGETEGEESGFELLIRENPFQGDDGKRAIVSASFTQEAVDGSKPLLARIIDQLIMKQGLNGQCDESVARVRISRGWFQRYMKLTLYPMLWLYNEYGIALEAHLQNSVIVLGEDGYPERFYYRDSQGYYYARSMIGYLEQDIEGIKESGNGFDDAIVEERFGYYLIVNHMLGMIQSFGRAGLVSEKVLLFDLYEALQSMRDLHRIYNGLIAAWLGKKELRIKANLITQCWDIDELENELEQAVYAQMPNPLHEIGAKAALIRKARQVTAPWRDQERLVPSQRSG